MENNQNQNVLSESKQDNNNNSNKKDNNDKKKDDFEENIEIKRSLEEKEEYDKSIKVIIIGDTNVGKSSIISRLNNQEFRELHTTLGIEHHTYLTSVNSFIIRMQIWDTAGQENFNSIINNYYKNTDVAIFVYSIDREDSFKNIQNWFNTVKEKSDQTTVNVLIGNKKDLENEERKVMSDRGEQFAVENEFFLFREVTCKSKDKDELENIMEIFDEIAKYFYDYYSHRRFASSSVDINYVASASIIKIGENSRKKKRCCG
jgi:small GTP-binding protein